MLLEIYVIFLNILLQDTDYVNSLFHCLSVGRLGLSMMNLGQLSNYLTVLSPFVLWHQRQLMAHGRARAHTHNQN